MDTQTDDQAPAVVSTSELDPMTADLAARGFGVVDNYPANHRLRAEALFADGQTVDPANHVTPEFIAETGERVTAERAEAERAEKAARVEAPKIGWTRDRLVAAANDVGIVVDVDMDKAAILAAIKAVPAGNEG
jgi:hypothetical protein